MDASEIFILIIEALSPLLIAALTWGAAKLAQFIKAKVENEYLAGVLVRLEDAVLTVVKSLQQTTVDAIKLANADGQLTDEEKEAIKQAAVAALKSYIGAKGLALVGKVLGLGDGALDQFLGDKIEAAVHDLKADKAAIGSSRAESPLPSPAG